MTADQFTKTCIALGLGKRDAAKLLRVDLRSIQRYYDGTREVPGPVSAFLDYLVASNKTGASAIKKLES